MSEGYDVKWVANSLLQIDFQRKRRTISPLKLQKLLYFLHGHHLVRLKQPAIDEPFQVWPHGPVIESIYHIFKEFGHEPITEYAYTWTPEGRVAYVLPPNLKDFHNLAGDIFRWYGRWSASHLSEMTHREGGPWHQAKKASETELSDESIRQAMMRNEDLMNLFLGGSTSD